MIRQKKLAAAFAATMTVLWMTATASFAHHLWIQETDGGFAVCRGTIGERLDPYDPSRVTHIAAKAVDGADIPLSRSNKEKQVTFTAKDRPVLVEATSEWGERVNTTQGKKLMSRQEAQAQGFTVVSAFRSTQYSKTLFAPSGINSLPLGLKFELVPLADPAASAPGTPLAFKLLFDGQPLAGATILTNQEQEAKTDADGVAFFSFEDGRAHLLYATHQTPADKDSGLDYLKFMTFLTFEATQ